MPRLSASAPSLPPSAHETQCVVVACVRCTGTGRSPPPPCKNTFCDGGTARVVDALVCPACAGVRGLRLRRGCAECERGYVRVEDASACEECSGRRKSVGCARCGRIGAVVRGVRVEEGVCGDGVRVVPFVRRVTIGDFKEGAGVRKEMDCLG